MKFNELTQLTLLIESLSDSGFLMTEAVKLAKELQDIFKKYDLEVPEEIDDVKEVKLKDKDLLKVFDGRKEQDLKMGKVLLKLFPALDQKTLLQIVGEIKAESSDDILFTIEKDVVKAYTTYCIDSCMSKTKNHLVFYTTQPDISIVIARKDGTPIGRALLWSKVEGAKNGMFMDRVYPADDEMIVAKFHKYAEQKGWSHRKTQKADDTDRDFPMVFNIKNADELIDRGFPYMDTFRFGEIGVPKLSNTPKTFKYEYVQTLMSTDGAIKLFHDKKVELSRKLQLAANAGNVELLKSLLDAGANIDANRGFALRVAVTNSDLEVAKTLLDAGADVHVDGDRPIAIAAAQGSIEMVKLLIDNGADVNADYDIPLHNAFYAGHFDIMKLLLDNGADATANNSIILRRAAEAGHLNVVKMLISSGADIHVEDGEALHNAAHHGHLDIVKELIERGTDIHSDDDKALRMAARFGSLNVVKYLLEKGADVHAKKDYALRWAVTNERRAVAKILLDAGADVHAQNDEVITYAKVSLRDRELAELIIAAAEKSK